MLLLIPTPGSIAFTDGDTNASLHSKKTCSSSYLKFLPLVLVMPSMALYHLPLLYWGSRQVCHLPEGTFLNEVKITCKYDNSGSWSHVKHLSCYSKPKPSPFDNIYITTCGRITLGSCTSFM